MFAGPREDPFFFDLVGFNRATATGDPSKFTGVDAFKGKNINAIVVEFPKAAVHRLMNESAPFNRTMDELYRRRATWTQARTHPLLAGFPDREIEQLLQEATFRVCQPGEIVYLEGAPPSDLFKTKVRMTVVGGEVVYGGVR